MAKDLKVDDKGDLFIDPVTHDLVIIEGIEEIAQRIKATLEIRYGEMQLLDPEMGMDYTDLLGKRFNEVDASSQIRETIQTYVPEVESVDNIKFTFLPNRHLQIDFKVTATPTESSNAETVEGSVDFGN